MLSNVTVVISTAEKGREEQATLLWFGLLIFHLCLIVQE